MKFKLPFLLMLSAVLCEAIGMAMLCLAGDRQTLCLFPIIPLVLASMKIHFREQYIFTLISAVVIIGGVLVYRGVNIEQTMVASLLLGHSLLWLLKDKRRYFYWRIGVCFLEVILAAILKPEAYMFFFIFFFLFFVSQTLAFRFLEENFENLDKPALDRPIRPGFLLWISGLSLASFIGGLLLFPLLPRSNISSRGNAVQSGYSEIINFKDGVSVWSSGDPRTLVWLFLPTELVGRLNGKLLRGKALEVFSEDGWRPAVKALMPRSQQKPSGVVVEAMREALATEVLPVPYGTTAVESELPVNHYASGEWFLFSRRNRKVKYHFSFEPVQEQPRKDEPRGIHLRLPQKGFLRIKALADELRQGTRSDMERVSRVQEYFRSFKAVLNNNETNESTGENLLENFLFRTKEGHCELFASVTALLFREMGMPSRVIAGFRMNGSSEGNVLLVKNTDAHAWVEVWVDGRNWVAVDTTPILLLSRNAFLEPWENFYDMVSAYWNRDILSYELDAREWRALAVKFLLFLVPGVLLIYIARETFLRLRKPPISSRERASKIYFQAIAKVESLNKSSFRDKVKSEYLRLRFGSMEPSQAQLNELQKSCSSAQFFAESSLGSIDEKS